MTEADLKLRTKNFALRVLQLVNEVPNTPAARAIGYQLIRSAMSVGANYRAACRGRSKKDFIAKLAIVDEEADESAYWLELIIGAKLLPESHVNPLLQEAFELTAIMASSRKTAARDF